MSNSIVFKARSIIKDKEGLWTTKKNEQNTATCQSMYETHTCNEWKKQDTKESLQYSSIYMKLKKQKTLNCIVQWLTIGKMIKKGKKLKSIKVSLVVTSWGKSSCNHKGAHRSSGCWWSSRSSNLDGDRSGIHFIITLLYTVYVYLMYVCMIYFPIEKNWAIWVLDPVLSCDVHGFFGIPPFKRWNQILLPLNVNWT